MKTRLIVSPSVSLTTDQASGVLQIIIKVTNMQRYKQKCRKLNAQVENALQLFIALEALADQLIEGMYEHNPDPQLSPPLVHHLFDDIQSKIDDLAIELARL